MTKKGEKYQGRWISGNKTVGFLESVLPDGKQYIGGWSYGKPQGLGIMVEKDGSYSIGEFKAGSLTEKGTLYDSEGRQMTRNGPPNDLP